MDLEPHFSHYFSVDGDAAGGNEFVGFAAGADAGIGDVFVETRGAVVWFGCGWRGLGFLLRGLEGLLFPRDIGCFFLPFVGSGTVGALAVAFAVVVATGVGSAVGVVGGTRSRCVGGFLFAVGVSLSVDFTAGCAGALAGAMLAVASALFLRLVIPL